MSKCRGCKADIIWVKTKAGKAMPCDPKKVTIVTEEGETVQGYIPHWVSCPVANRFKENKESED